MTQDREESWFLLRNNYRRETACAQDLAEQQKKAVRQGPAPWPQRYWLVMVFSFLKQIVCEAKDI